MPVFSTPEEQEKQYKRLRRDTGANASLLDDDLAEEMFEEALELYPDDTAKMIAYARVVVLRMIRASSAMLGRYAQGQSEENLEKVFDNLTTMLEDAVANVDKAADPIDSNVAPFFFGTAPGYRGR